MRLKYMAFFSLLLLIQLTHAQDTIVDRPIRPLEIKGDDYLPNASLKKKVSTPYCLKSRTGSESQSSIFTVQVNLDSTGQNILGDAANEPNISIHPDNGNLLVIGWRQFDNVSSNFRQAGLGYSTDAGLHWISPGVLEPGVFRTDPVLDFDLDGTIYYNSLEYTDDLVWQCKVFRSADGGATWDAGVDARGGDKQWMVIDRTSGEGSGNIYSYWSRDFSSCYPNLFTRSWNEGDSYEECSDFSGDPHWGTMEVGIGGELFIAGMNGLSNEVGVAKSTNAQIPDATILWEQYVTVDMDGYSDVGVSSINPGGLVGQINIDMDKSNGPGSGNIYLLAALYRNSVEDQGDIMFCKSTDGGVTWSDAIKINDDTSEENVQWFGTQSVAPNGRIDAVWLDTRDAEPGSDFSALYYSYSTDQGLTWSVNEKLSDNFDPHLGYPNQNKMGDYFDMISTNEGAHLAWANTFNGEQDVYYSYIIPGTLTSVNEVLIYPNPVHGSAIFFTRTRADEVEIFDALGQLVLSMESPAIYFELDVSAYSTGIYYSKTKFQNGTSLVEKFVVE
jgi:hypothetical protein